MQISVILAPEELQNCSSPISPSPPHALSSTVPPPMAVDVGLLRKDSNLASGASTNNLFLYLYLSLP